MMIVKFTRILVFRSFYIWWFPKLVVPNNHGFSCFPTTNDHFEVFWWYHHPPFKETPIYSHIFLYVVSQVERALNALPFKIETPGQQRREKDLLNSLATWKICHLLGGSNSNMFFSPRKLGKISNLNSIFWNGWNHQLVRSATSYFVIICIICWHFETYIFVVKADDFWFFRQCKKSHFLTHSKGEMCFASTQQIQ